MVRTVILGDVHGYNALGILSRWASVDNVILLGDYLDSYDDINPINQIANAKNIFDYVDAHSNMVTLMGNHDLHYITDLDASSRQFSFQAYDEACLLMRERYNKGLLYDMKKVGKILCSHAGVTNTWYENKKIDSVTLRTSLESLVYNREDISMYGANIKQGPCWVRPSWALPAAYQRIFSFLDEDPYFEGGYQIVGHSRTPQVFMQDSIIYCDCLKKEHVIVDQEDDGDVRIYAVDSNTFKQRIIL